MSAPRPKFDIVTVVFGAETGLLKLQARSLAQFWNPDLIGSIIVVVNDRDEDRCLRNVQQMLDDYGALKGKVTILRPDQLFNPTADSFRSKIERVFVTHVHGWFRDLLPHRARLASGWARNSGWAMQQAFKLLAVQKCAAENVLILDAKNHFAAPVDALDFLDSSGKSKTRYLVPGEQQKKWLLASFDVVGLARSDCRDECPPTTTPMVLPTSAMRKAVAALRAIVGPPELFFAFRRRKACEFMLLYALIEKEQGGWRNMFVEGLTPATSLSSGQPDTLVNLGLQTDAPAAKLVALHRRNLTKLTDKERRTLADFWQDLGLLRSDAEASEVLNA